MNSQSPRRTAWYQRMACSRTHRSRWSELIARRELRCTPLYMSGRRMTVSRCNQRWNGKQSQHRTGSPVACNRGRRRLRRFRGSFLCHHCTETQQLGARRTPLEGGSTLLGREHTAGPSIPSTECLGYPWVPRSPGEWRRADRPRSHQRCNMLGFSRIAAHNCRRSQCQSLFRP